MREDEKGSPLKRPGMKNFVTGKDVPLEEIEDFTEYFPQLLEGVPPEEQPIAQLYLLYKDEGLENKEAYVKALDSYTDRVMEGRRK